MSSVTPEEVAEELAERRSGLAEAITAMHYAARPELDARWGPAGRRRCLEDAAHHLEYLQQAVARESPALFVDYVAWARVLLVGLGIGADDLAANLEFVRSVLQQALPAESAALACAPLDAALVALPAMPDRHPSAIAPDGLHAAMARRYLDALLGGDRPTAAGLITDALAAGTPVRELYLYVFQPTQREVGRLWQSNTVSVAQEHFCTAATQLIMSQCYPHIFATERCGRSLVATCAQGDLHEIGVRMVADFFEMAGWDSHYLGANTPIGAVVQTVCEQRPDVLAIGATITRHVREVRDVIAAVRASPGTDGCRILVGGYPFGVAEDLWRRVGADGSAADADGAVATAQRLCGPGGA